MAAVGSQIHCFNEYIAELTDRDLFKRLDLLFACPFMLLSHLALLSISDES